jgi:hypothetical protein
MNGGNLKELRFRPLIFLADCDHEMLNAYLQSVNQREVKHPLPLDLLTSDPQELNKAVDTAFAHHLIVDVEEQQIGVLLIVHRAKLVVYISIQVCSLKAAFRVRQNLISFPITSTVRFKNDSIIHKFLLIE